MPLAGEAVKPLTFLALIVNGDSDDLPNINSMRTAQCVSEGDAAMEQSSSL
jgi:hypothetical protein